MRKMLLILAAALTLAPAAFAQNFTLAGRYSNYATSLDTGLFSVDTNRESSVGAVGEFRSGAFVARGQWDHDFNAGINAVSFLPVEVAEFSRDRGEASIGFGVLPYLDLEGGIRYDKMTLSSSDFFGSTVFEPLDLKHQALAAGVTVHSPVVNARGKNRPIGWYGTARAYFGNADFNLNGVPLSSDTTGYKVEGGVAIPVGVTGWSVTPGAEYEHLETKDFGLDFDTNRFFVNVGYTF